MSRGSAQHVETVAAVLVWMLCSSGMTVFNKLAIKAFPLDCTLVAIQMGFTVVVLVLYDRLSPGGTIHIGSLHDALRWLMNIPFFTGMLLCSVLALDQGSMTLYVAFRALSPVPALVIERFFPDPLHVNLPMIGSIVVMVVGTWIYALQLPYGGLRGLPWVLLNLSLNLCSILLSRLMLAKQQRPVDISKAGCALLTNFFGTILLLIGAAIAQEFEKVPGAVRALDMQGAIWVLCSCLVGAGISYTAVWAQSYVTATTFLVLVNATNFPIIFLEAFVLRTKTLGALQFLGAVINIVGNFMYGFARRIQESSDDGKLAQEERDERLPLVADKQAEKMAPMHRLLMQQPAWW